MSTPCHLQNLRPMLNEHDCSVTVMTLPPGLNLIHSYCQHSLLFRFCLSHGLNQTECKEKYRQYGIPQTFRWQGCGPCKVSVCSALSEATEVQYPQNKDSTKSNLVLTLWGWVSAASRTGMYLSLTSNMNLWFQNQVWCSLCQNGAKHVICDSCYNITISAVAHLQSLILTIFTSCVPSVTRWRSKPLNTRNRTEWVF